MSDKETSTLRSYIDSATGTIRNKVGNLTGSNAEQEAGAAKKDKSEAEYNDSQATAKIGGYTASNTGHVTKDDPNRSGGSWNQTFGSGKEMVGNLVGSEGLKHKGQQQQVDGKAQEAQGQVNDLSSGIGNRVSGLVGKGVATMTGDREAQTAAQEQHDAGKTKQQGVVNDIQKQNQ